MSVTSWFLVSSSGTRHRLPKEMIFVGREDCELMLQSRSVDKQHAVINYNLTTDEHLVKDLGSLNGTFVNDLRIPDQTYITLKLSDVIRFGYDSSVYVLERSQHKVPEEALKHEKYSSQLQMNLKGLEVKKAEMEDRMRTTSSKSLTQEASVCRPTPLYGQPSWWGEEDYGSKVHSSDEHHAEMQKEASSVDPDVSQQKSIFLSYHREPSYFEIPTKDFQQLKPSEPEVHEIPTKDTDAPPVCSSPPTSTPPVIQSHASFTIEFDDCMPGKIKIKDHVTKFSTRQRKQHSLPSKAMIPTPTDVMSAESKVADWLVRSDISIMKRRPTSEDVYSTKSDLAMNAKILKGHHHEDGTQSDSEDPVLNGSKSTPYHDVQCEQSEVAQQMVQYDQSIPFQSPPPTQVLNKPLQDSTPSLSVAPDHILPQRSSQAQSPTMESSQQGPHEHLTQQAFIIEFFDDNPRKKRSQSFTHNPTHADSHSTLKAKMERRKGSDRPASVHGHILPTQQVMVPLKGQGHSCPQRSSSLKRDKAETEAASSGSSSRSSSGMFIRPFSSIGKQSKLTQEFTAEFQKASCQHDLSPTRDKTSAPPGMVSPPHARALLSPGPSVAASDLYPASTLQAPGKSESTISINAAGQAPSPGHSSGRPMSPVLPLGVRGTDPKCSQRMRNEEDDSLSDAGTYTIETEAQDKEVEQARNMIDQVFGVLDSPEYSGVNTGVYRPVINDGKDEQANMDSDSSTIVALHGLIPAAVSSLPTGQMQVPAGPGLEGPKWVSCWASLADSYAEPGSTPPQGDCLEDLHLISRWMGSCDNSESESSHSSRTRRLLPQVPPERLENVPGIRVRHEHFQGQESLERVSPCPQDSSQHLSIQDDVDPDSLSDASRSDDGPFMEKTKKNPANVGSGSTSFYIGSEDSPGRLHKVKNQGPPEKTLDPRTKSPPTTVLICNLSGHETRRTGVKPNSSAPNLQTQDKDMVSFSSVVRQESFTKDRSSDTVQVKKLPHISSHPSMIDMEQRRESLQDSQPLLQEPVGALATLDTRFTSGSRRGSKKGGSSSHIDESLSGESDVDTASTVSQKEKSSSSPSIQEKGRTARERLSEKRRHQGIAEATSKTEPTKQNFQMRRSQGNCGSLDLSAGHQGSAPQWSEYASSDYETSGQSSRSKKLITPLQKEDNGKTSKVANQQVLMRSNSLSAPRPTRASMLRRARLGEASDNEGAETDRGSHSSDPISAPAKVSAEGKKLSRLDILAMPRKRTGSFTTPSDSETSSTGRGNFSNRTSEVVVATRKSFVGDARPAANKGGGAHGKQMANRNRSNGAKSSSAGSHQKPKALDCSSSEEEDYERNSATLKPKLPSQNSAPAQKTTGRRTAAPRSKSVSLEMEDDDQDELDPYQNWTTHSAEIAKLSQDLAKDLAILAKEIHDVAGDGDSPSSGTGMTASPSSLPNTPASTISAREELVQHIPEASLNYQKVPPGSAAVSDLDANMNEPESSSKHHRPWKREEALLDNLMLNPVSQLSQAIRENTEQLADKMKVLFQNKAEVWEEIEAKINAEEVPILKTSNKELTSILKELRRVQKQLEVINTIVEPGGNIPPAVTSSRGPPRASVKERKPTTRGRGVPPTTNANESTKRAARGGDSVQLAS
ncbi:centrosomal protein of 170 kDa protein B isoform X2 [Takifugu flavidus]|uniref:centrosomal protein of 170 kDa protein B isoform X2 n=1 Tax=Takifugu flavidus TaxID=433684 RepID=UPI002544BA29|nr:centrosomal protein of 170 kDa protein B isoform X2 [Takifugu flavidus]